MRLPEKISSLIADEGYREDDIGMSGSSVRIYRDKVLKIQECGEEAENEYRMMRYLKGRIPVPEVYSYDISEGSSYLLMSKCRGQMACADGYMREPAIQCRLLAKGLKRLWSVDISDCPSDWRLSHKLARAEYNVKKGLVDMDNVEPETFGENGFRDPAELLGWLYENAPEEEPVLSHGDYCLPNLFGIGEEVTGYIDLGRTGIADKWCDIALCYRSLSYNFTGKYSSDRDSEEAGSKEKGLQEKGSEETARMYDDMLLFRELGIEPDWEKIRYYILLDELF